MKYLWINIEQNDQQDIENLYKTLDQSEQLKKMLKEGQSTLILNQKSKISNLSQLLSFQIEQINDQQLENQQQIILEYPENKSKNIQVGEFDEDMSEIKFNPDPKYFHDVSNNLQTTLITDNLKTLKFCQQIKIDHVFETNINHQFLQQLNLQEQLQNKVLIILDFDPSSLNIKNIDEILASLITTYNPLTSLTVSPLPQHTFKAIENLHLIRNNENIQKNSLIQQIIPNQTIQYRKGILDANQKYSETEHYYSIAITNFTQSIRKDQIESFASYLKIEGGLDKTENGIINGNCYFREILFRTGKLPKFGA